MMNRKLTLIPAAVALAFGLAACDRAEQQAVGAKVDQAVAGAKAEANDAAQAAKESVKEAGANVAAAANDAMITARINAALAADDLLKATRIDVDTQAGHVVLKGSAPDAASRERATTLARAVEGVVEVDNRLTVVAS
ncbi:BON domain-containing protein [Piscinibacter sp.]|uniref:BON domain-containing protein n=1 Tax=Piscinibacter sp. TaxID=1903157 RepID=UPI0039E28720